MALNAARPAWPALAVLFLLAGCTTVAPEAEAERCDSWRTEPFHVPGSFAATGNGLWANDGASSYAGDSGLTGVSRVDPADARVSFHWKVDNPGGPSWPSLLDVWTPTTFSRDDVTDLILAFLALGGVPATALTNVTSMNEEDGVASLWVATVATNVDAFRETVVGDRVPQVRYGFGHKTEELDGWRFSYVFEVRVTATHVDGGGAVIIQVDARDMMAIRSHGGQLTRAQVTESAMAWLTDDFGADPLAGAMWQCGDEPPRT